MFSEVHQRVKKAGQAPGTPTYTGEANNTPPDVTIITYSGDDFKQTTSHQLDESLLTTKSSTTTWVDIQKLHDVPLIEQLAKHYDLHPLTLEDILNVQQRPKVEEFEKYIFITLKMLALNVKTGTFSIKQVSFIIGKDFILSLQECNTDFFTSMQKKIVNPINKNLREQGADYLAYRLIDAVIDQYFVVLENLGNQIEILEERIIADPKPANARMLYQLKRKMLQ